MVPVEISKRNTKIMQIRYSGYEWYTLFNAQIDFISLTNTHVKPLMLCENLCERNFSKAAKIGKKQKRCGKTYLTNSIVYNTLRGLGNSEVLYTNP